MNPLDQLTTALADRYEVEHEIGAGGMATVYLARDLKHNRKVALKVLKPELGAVLGVERFLSEIQVTANLQHPNLLPLFDSGEASGLLFYVMPYVEGESLRARLDREKQLPVDEAVRIAVAIAGALDYAHQHGVIHRDMKPENILLQAGQPVIADFGIALAVSNAGGARVTQTGLSLGTPQYMSPEQATGDRVIDGRTDIYSLAAMTYEMLTGEPPHTGTSAQAIIAKLMTEDVRPLTVLRRAVPPHVDAAVRHGLEKLAADRFATAGEFAAALTGARPFLLTGAAAGAAGAGSPAMFGMTGRTRALVAALVAALAVVAIGGVGTTAWLATRPAPRAAAVAFDIGLPDSVALYGGGGTKLALSRDGSKLVFVGVKNGKIALYLRRLDDPVAQLIRGTELVSSGGNVSPALSRDGEWVAFEDNRVLKKVPVGGGTAQVVGDSGSGISWGTRGAIASTAGGVRVGTPDSRTVRRLARPDSSRGIFDLSWLDILPGDEYALVTLTTTRSGPPTDSMRLGVVSLTDGTVTDLGIRGINAHYVASGDVLFGRSPGLVMVAPFSLRTRTFTGPESVLLENVWLGGGGAAGFTVSDNGTIAFHRGDQGVRRDLVAVNRTGGERRIPGDGREFFSPRVSPDGARMLASVGGAMNSRSTYVALVDAATGATQLMSSPDSGYLSAWSRDGSHALVARHDAKGSFELASRPWDKSAAETVLARHLPARVTDISPGSAHGFAAMAMTRGAFSSDVLIAPMDSLGAGRPFVTGSSTNFAPAVSADGKLLAWTSNESGKWQVYLTPIPGPGPRLQVSVEGGKEPVWSRSGSTLFFRGPGRMMLAEIAAAPLKVGKRDSLFVDRYVSGITDTVNWDLFPGGNEFLMVRQESLTSSAPQVVLNWPQLMARQGGAGAPER